jgi:hypothetical protein
MRESQFGVLRGLRQTAVTSALFAPFVDMTTAADMPLQNINASTQSGVTP